MFTIKYLEKGTNKILVEVIIATKESTAKKWAKQYLLHHCNYELLAIQPC